MHEVCGDRRRGRFEQSNRYANALAWHNPCTASCMQRKTLTVSSKPDVVSEPALPAAPIRVMLVDESPERTAMLKTSLESSGYEVVEALATSLELIAAVEQSRPEVIIIDVDSPSRDVLEGLSVMGRDHPRPVVMFANDDDTQTIRAATRAGVSAYVVDGLVPSRVKTIIDVARARFEEHQAELASLREALQDTQQRLAERKLVDRAKGILMQRKQLSEEAAYRELRELAMRRKLRIGDAARLLIEAADLLA
jgi:response regulator NasT